MRSCTRAYFLLVFKAYVHKSTCQGDMLQFPYKSTRSPNTHMDTLNTFARERTHAHTFWRKSMQLSYLNISEFNHILNAAFVQAYSVLVRPTHWLGRYLATSHNLFVLIRAYFYWYLAVTKWVIDSNGHSWENRLILGLYNDAFSTA